MAQKQAAAGAGAQRDLLVDGVPPDSKPENVEAMTEAVFKYGVH